jgi:hypothetical protein
LSGLVRQLAQQPFHDCPLSPSAPRPNRGFQNYYIDDSSIVYNEIGWFR